MSSHRRAEGDPFRARLRRRGRAAIALIFWVVGVVLMALPFLGAKASPSWIVYTGEEEDWTVKDPTRNPEKDVPLIVDSVGFDREFAGEVEGSLVELIASELEEHYGFDSQRLADSGVIDINRLAAGRDQYVARCAGCHGLDGDGGGPAARYLLPRPRNFQSGVYKFTTTPTGARPTREDLFATIRRGLAGASMPAFPLMSDERRWDIVEYVRWLSVRGEFQSLMLDYAWEDEELPDEDAIAEIVELVDERWSPEELVPQFPGAPEPEFTQESVDKGRELYVDSTRANCVTCHGETGIGDGPSAGEYVDHWGYPIRPRDFTTGVFRAGQRGQDLYLSIATGINGTPMPAYEGVMEPEEIWHLVHYVQSLGNRKPAN